MTEAAPTVRRQGGVPAARQTLALLQALARQPGAVPAAALARDLGLPRSTTYHLLAELMAAGFVVHLPEERRYGLGVSAFEIGSAYSRQEPLARLARPVLARLVDAVGQSAHLAVLHGREVLYVVEQRAPGRPPLVTDVGVRLPAQLTASGRAHARRPARPPRAGAVPRRRARSSTGTAPAPNRLSDLRRLLLAVRRTGHATEDGDVTPGFASVAAAVHDHAGRPVASVAVTFPAEEVDPAARDELARRVTRSAAELTRRINGHPPGTWANCLGSQTRPADEGLGQRPRPAVCDEAHALRPGSRGDRPGQPRRTSSASPATGTACGWPTTPWPRSPAAGTSSTGSPRTTSPHYGISTGFGALATTHIPPERRAQLQRSLIRSHAAGSGPEVEREVVRALMLLRLSTLATGRTGVRVGTAQAYAAMLDAGHHAGRARVRLARAAPATWRRSHRSPWR